MKGINNKYLIVAVLILLGLFIWKFTEKTQIIQEFPLDNINDLSSYLAKLHFLKEYGYHNTVPNWYNAQYTLFEVYPPAWYFFTYPILLITKHITLSTIISMFLLYLIALFSVILLLKKQQLSFIESLLYFSIVFANPMVIGNFIRLGRPHELFGFLSLFIMFAILLLYKNKDLDKNFLWIIIPYSLTMLNHVPIFILATLTLLGLFLSHKTKKDILILSSVFLITALLTSFWWFDFLKFTLSDSNVLSAEYEFAKRLISLNPLYYIENITSFIIGLIFLISFWFYKKTNALTKKEFYFFTLPFIIGILFFSRLVAFIPFLNRLYPDTYNVYLLIYSAFFFIKIDFTKFSYLLRKVVSLSLIFISLISVLAYISLIPGSPQYDQQTKETLNLLKEVEGKFLVLNTEKQSSQFYSYAAIYLNLSTPSGWSNPSVPAEYVEKVESIRFILKQKDCNELNKILKEVKTEEVISYKEDCKTLEMCGLIKKDIKELSCLYQVK